jgi:hypothetical protein
MKRQPLYNVKQVRELFFPGRCMRWIRDTFSDGELGYVARDAGGWLISAAAIEKWFEIHQPKKLTPPRATQISNLTQNQ